MLVCQAQACLVPTRTLKAAISLSRVICPHTVLVNFPESLQSVQEPSKDVSPSCPAVSSKTAMSRSGQAIAQREPTPYESSDAGVIKQR